MTLYILLPHRRCLGRQAGPCSVSEVSLSLIWRWRSWRSERPKLLGSEQYCRDEISRPLGKCAQRGQHGDSRDPTTIKRASCSIALTRKARCGNHRLGARQLRTRSCSRRSVSLLRSIRPLSGRRSRRGGCSQLGSVSDGSAGIRMLFR